MDILVYYYILLAHSKHRKVLQMLCLYNENLRFTRILSIWCKLPPDIVKSGSIYSGMHSKMDSAIYDTSCFQSILIFVNNVNLNFTLPGRIFYEWLQGVQGTYDRSLYRHKITNKQKQKII